MSNGEQTGWHHQSYYEPREFRTIALMPSFGSLFGSDVIRKNDTLCGKPIACGPLVSYLLSQFIKHKDDVCAQQYPCESRYPLDKQESTNGSMRNIKVQ